MLTSPLATPYKPFMSHIAEVRRLKNILVFFSVQSDCYKGLATTLVLRWKGLASARADAMEIEWGIKIPVIYS